MAYFGKKWASFPVQWASFPVQWASFPSQYQEMGGIFWSGRLFLKKWSWQKLVPSEFPGIKIEVFAALGYKLHLELASTCVRASCRAKPRLRTQNASQNARPETGKQHGLASSIFELRWSDLQCQTSRPEPIKNEDFATAGLNLHLQVGTFRCVWASRRAKPRLLTQKPSQKGSPRNGETAWPGVASRSYKKRGFCSCGAQFAPPIVPSKCTVGTFRCVWASRRAKPRLLTQKPSQKGSPRNGETAWPGELKDTVFRPCVGMIFNVKRCVQNL